MRRQGHYDAGKAVDEEMDIGAANARRATRPWTCSGLASSPADLPHPGRFELTNETAVDDAGQSPDDSSSLHPASPARRERLAGQAPPAAVLHWCQLFGPASVAESVHTAAPTGATALRRRVSKRNGSKHRPAAVWGAAVCRVR